MRWKECRAHFLSVPFETVWVIRVTISQKSPCVSADDYYTANCQTWLVEFLTVLWVLEKNSLSWMFYSCKTDWTHRFSRVFGKFSSCFYWPVTFCGSGCHWSNHILSLFCKYLRNLFLVQPHTIVVPLRTFIYYSFDLCKTICIWIRYFCCLFNQKLARLNGFLI